VSLFDQKNLKPPIPLTGYDLCTLKTLLPVLEAATTSGQEQTAVESTLVPGPAYQGNYLLVAPVAGGNATTAAGRRAQRIGWVATLVDGPKMLEAALGAAGDRVGIELFSGSRPSPAQLVVRDPIGLKPSATGTVTEHFVDGGTWTLRVSTLPGAPGPANPWEVPGIVFVLAMLLNLALAAFVWDLGQGRLRATRSFRASERRFQSLASYTPVGILEMAEDGTTLYFNTRLNEIAGVDDAFWENHGWLECVHPADRASVVAIALSARESRDDTGASFRLLRPTGEVRNVRMLAAPVTEEADGPLSFVITVQDVTEEVAATEALAFQAMHDSLTGLPNRALFLDRLTHELASATR
jgi:PAS domain S-box-containing protein